MDVLRLVGFRARQPDCEEAFVQKGLGLLGLDLERNGDGSLELALTLPASVADLVFRVRLRLALYIEDQHVANTELLRSSTLTPGANGVTITPSSPVQMFTLISRVVLIRQTNIANWRYR